MGILDERAGVSERSRGHDWDLSSCQEQAADLITQTYHHHSVKCLTGRRSKALEPGTVLTEAIIW